MNRHHGRHAARPKETIVSAIIAGRPWTARRIRNNCLRQHCHALARSLRTPGMEQFRLTVARLLDVLETRSRVLTEIHPTELQVVPATMRIAAYVASWIRNPEDWSPDETADALTQWASLIRHLFAMFPVPAHLDVAWQVAGPLEHFERDCWCALAQGRSLRSVWGFPPSISARVLHRALTSARGKCLREALWLAQLDCLGASPGLRSAVKSSRVMRELNHHATWVRLVTKFAAGSESVAAHFPMVADAMAASDAPINPLRAEQLLALPLLSLIRYSIKLVLRFLADKGQPLSEEQVRQAAAERKITRLAATTWRPTAFVPTYESPHGRVHDLAGWKVVELCSVQDLKEEGEILKHCVVRYAGRCKQGSSVIFSLQRFRYPEAGPVEVLRMATIELHPRTRRVVQIKAWRNRPPNNTCMKIIGEWIRANRLQ